MAETKEGKKGGEVVRFKIKNTIRELIREKDRKRKCRSRDVKRKRRIIWILCQNKNT